MIKLLLVDDEVEIRNGIKTKVNWSQNGIDVCGEAGNGREAIELINTLHPDVMLIDVRMPAMGGLEVVEYTTAHFPEIRSIIISGYDDFSYAQKALKLGAVDYLLKPCMPGNILDTVIKAKKAIEEDRAQKEKYNKIKMRLTEVLPQQKEILPGVGTEALEKNAQNDSSAPEKTRTIDRAIESATEFIQKNFNSDLSLKAVAKEVHLTPAYLSYMFKQSLGTNFVDYLNKTRLEKACALFRNTYMKTYEIAASVGYNDEKYFSYVFKKYMGKTPTQYRDEVW